MTRNCLTDLRSSRLEQKLCLYLFHDAFRRKGLLWGTSNSPEYLFRCRYDETNSVKWVSNVSSGHGHQNDGGGFLTSFSCSL